MQEQCSRVGFAYLITAEIASVLDFPASAFSYTKGSAKVTSSASPLSWPAILETIYDLNLLSKNFWMPSFDAFTCIMIEIGLSEPRSRRDKGLMV
jgi:hypothetical protein